MNALLDQTRSKRIDLGLPVLEQHRVSPTLFEVLAHEKAADETWGQFAERGMIALSIMRRASRMDLAGVSSLVVRLEGGAADEVVGRLTNVRTADGCQTNAATVRVSDAEMRRMNGATRLPR